MTRTILVLFMSASRAKASCEACSLLIPPHPLQPTAIPRLAPTTNHHFTAQLRHFAGPKFCKSEMTVAKLKESLKRT